MGAALRIWFNWPLWARVLGGLIAGMAVGLAWGPGAEALKPLGDVFLAAIRMLVVPLVFTSIVAGVTSLGNPAELGRVGGRMFALYVGSMIVAVAGGIFWANLFQPGIGAPPMGGDVPTDRPDVRILDVLVGIVPTNIVQAMVELDVLSIIFFAILFGLGVVATGEAGKPVKDFFHAAQEALFKVTHWVMEIAPFGVFALIAVVAGKFGLEALTPLAKLIMTLYVGGVVHLLLVYVVLVGLVSRLNIFRFVRNALDALLVAFSTSSSNATLPVAMAVVEKKMGVKKSMTSFVMPIGASLSMDGTVMHFGIVTVFTAQAFGVDLGVADYLAIGLTAILAAMGASGIPSASLVLLPMMLASVGLPLEVVALIAGIDRILDMARTTLNVSIDLVVATLVGKSEGAMDMAVFRGEHTGR
jgi:Na+/H+-dicarboxylate symporter